MNHGDAAGSDQLDHEVSVRHRIDGICRRRRKPEILSQGDAIDRKSAAGKGAGAQR